MINLTNRTVLVAGGAGFVGSAVIRELLEDGAKVVCLDNYLHGTWSNVEHCKGPLTVIQADVIEWWKIIKLLKDYEVEYIIDCIGDTYVPSSYEMPLRFFNINLQGTFNLLMAARLCGVKRVVYVSSTEVYGQPNSERFTESMPLSPLNTYAVSKLAADRLCFSLYTEHQVPVVIARIFNCYGPRATHPYIIPEIISQLSRGSVLKLGNIKAVRDLTYVHDTARALIEVLISEIDNGDVVNVGSDNAYSVEGLAVKIAEIMGVSDLQIKVDQTRFRHLDLNYLRCDNTKLKQYTGWTPIVSIEEGLQMTLNWYRDHGSSWRWENTMSDIRY
jgi:nucleoside-diphosphate-sugar epimerase